MSEKQFEIICEDSSLVDVPVYVISDDKLKFDIYGSKKDAERLCTLLNENEQLKKEIGIDNEVVKIIKKHLPIGFVGGLVDKQIENTVKSIVEELREEEDLKKLFLNEYGGVDD